VYIVADTLFTSNQATTGVGVKLFFTWEELEFFGPNADMRYQYTYTSAPEVGSPTDAQNVAGSPVVHLR